MQPDPELTFPRVVVVGREVHNVETLCCLCCRVEIRGIVKKTNMEHRRAFTLSQLL